jgi:hypothetical protein
MQGYEDFNFGAFYAAEDFWKETQAFDRVGNPAKWDAVEYGEGSNVCPTGDIEKYAREKGFCMRSALKKDLSWIANYATHLYMLRGWELSKGAKAEHALAVALGLEIMYEC